MSSSEVARAVIASSYNSFDQFAKLWVEILGPNALLNSLFCQINSKVHELSYCIKIGESGAIISVIHRNDEDPMSFVKRDFHCDKNEEEEEEEEEEADDDCDGFDWLNLRDWSYQTKYSAATKLRKALDFVDGRLPDVDDTGDCELALVTCKYIPLLKPG